MRCTYRLISVFLCGMALAPGGLLAQLPKVPRQKPGSLSGEVITAKGSAVSGAQVIWQSADGGTPHVLHTDSHGHFHLQSLRAGLYDMRASVGRTFSEWKKNVVVSPGAESDVTLQLTFKAPPPS